MKRYTDNECDGRFSDVRAGRNGGMSRVQPHSDRLCSRMSSSERGGRFSDVRLGRGDDGLNVGGQSRSRSHSDRLSSRRS